MKCPVLVCVDAAVQSFPQNWDLELEPSDLYTALVKHLKVWVDTAALHRGLPDAEQHRSVRPVVPHRPEGNRELPPC